MGSLQTEIEKTLNSWNAPVKSIAQKVFEFVQNHPTCTATDVANGTGVDMGRASATLLTLYQKGKLDRKAYTNPNPDGKRDQVYSYWTEIENFTAKTERRVAKKPKKVKALSKADVSVEEPKQYEIPRMKQAFDPETFVKGLSLTEVKQLHKFLESYFE